jgi:hypothetical protein
MAFQRRAEGFEYFFDGLVEFFLTAILCFDCGQYRVQIFVHLESPENNVRCDV